jgi:IS30 family transposase
MMPAWPAVGRGVNGNWCESAHRQARKLASRPRVAPKLVVGNSLWMDVLTALASGLSPQQTSGTLARMQPHQRISHESIYSAI